MAIIMKCLIVVVEQCKTLSGIGVVLCVPVPQKEF